MVAPTIRVTLDKSEALKALNPSKSEIKRASRLVINKITNDVHTDLGGRLPRGSGIQVGGFRRVRTRKTKAKGNILSGTVWVGGNKVAAKYVGKPKNVTGGAQAGKHFFAGAFVATMSNGYTSVFKRDQDDKLQEQTVEVKNLHLEAERSVARHAKAGSRLLKTEIEKIIRRRK